MMNGDLTDDLQPEPRRRRSCCLGCLGRLLAGFFLLLVLITGGVLVSFIFFPPFGDKLVARILVAGLDEPEMPGYPRRSDTIILCAARLDGSGITLLSVPRDSYVRIPRHGTGKINGAYALGGLPLLKKTLAQPAVLEANLPFHVSFDSSTVAAMIDALGGVEVDVPHAMDYDDDWGNLHIHLKPGQQVLTGKQVVGYLRWRKNNRGPSPGGDDFRRTARQRELLGAIAHKVRTVQGMMKLPAVYRAFQTSAPVKPNLTFRQMIALAFAARQVTPDAVPGVSVKRGDTSFVRCDWRAGRAKWRKATDGAGSKAGVVSSE